jgi:hypothetical protein
MHVRQWLEMEVHRPGQQQFQPQRLILAETAIAGLEAAAVANGSGTSDRGAGRHIHHGVIEERYRSSG